MTFRYINKWALLTWIVYSIFCQVLLWLSEAPRPNLSQTCYLYPCRRVAMFCCPMLELITGNSATISATLHTFSKKTYCGTVGMNLLNSTVKDGNARQTHTNGSWNRFMGGSCIKSLKAMCVTEARQIVYCVSKHNKYQDSQYCLQNE